MAKNTLSILALIFLTAQGVYAEEPLTDEASDIEAFEKCYERSKPSEVFETCDHKQKCIALGGENSSSLGMLKCGRKSYEIWDRKLNEEYRVLRSILEKLDRKTAQEALKEAQRSWITFRDKDCFAKMETSVYRGVTAGAIRSSCLNRHTARRTAELRSQSQFYIQLGYEP